MSKLPGRKSGQFGFTLVELITIIVVIGILGAVAVPVLFDRKGFDATSFADQVRSLIRYGQKVAIAQNRNVYVLVSADRVALCYDATVNCGSRVTAPSGANSGSSSTLQQCSNSSTWACEGRPSGLTLTAATTFYFDPTGKPFSSADVPPTLNSSFSTPAQIITVSGDGLNHNTTVTAETGYVY